MLPQSIRTLKMINAIDFMCVTINRQSEEFEFEMHMLPTIVFAQLHLYVDQVR